ncbi:hypothetical protein BWI17_03775 [Betaproteobacteria bacterium GR16-43]|nr:hypothetical protein BWI17_03775 [Betaproteobacteria bacterium GR16-43]
MIKVERVKANHYRVRVPKNLEGDLREAEVILAYSNQHPGGIPIYEPYETISTRPIGKSLVGEFAVRKGEGRPYVNVMWWHKRPGMCGISAHTGFLAVQ